MKPTAYYTGPIMVSYDYLKDYSRALLSFVEHPLLGKVEGITTSQIISPPDKYGCFETKNTFYKPIEFSLISEEFITSLEVNDET
ncbi:hypothetical protein EB001_23925 [bacterium]|nr:hypothetical protein [bacterium]